MIAYYITYKINEKPYEILIDAKDFKSATIKIGKRHGYNSNREVKVTNVNVIGYF